ncbi:MAG: tetratricopeptide repeat protein [Chitinophagaceae bacterium]
MKMKRRSCLLLSLLFLFVTGNAQPKTNGTKTTQAPTKNDIEQKKLFDTFFLLSEGDTVTLKKKSAMLAPIRKLNPSSQYSWYCGSWAIIMLNRFEPVDSFTAVAADIEEMIEKAPTFAEIYYLKGQYLFYSGQTGYIEQMQKCIELNPKLSMPYYFLATDYNDSKNYKLSLAYYNLLEKADPAFRSLYYNRGNIKSQLEDYEGAVADFTKALAIRPDDYRILYNRGTNYLQLENYIAGEKDLTAFLKVMPGYAVGWYNRALSRYYQKRYTEACEDFKKAAKLGDEASIDYVSKNCK